MSRIIKTTVVFACILLCGNIFAQERGHGYRGEMQFQRASNGDNGNRREFHPENRFDVFAPIGKYIAKGDAECLSAWFDESLEISIISQESTASRAQAKRIVKSFFDSYTPRSFSVGHKAEQGSMKYALGTLNAGGEMFNVTIFVRAHHDGYKIQQFKIERQQD